MSFGKIELFWLLFVFFLRGLQTVSHNLCLGHYFVQALEKVQWAKVHKARLSLGDVGNGWVTLAKHRNRKALLFLKVTLIEKLLEKAIDPHARNTLITH